MVDGFTVMTYDASRPERPGFNAPLPWVENNMRLLVDAEHAVEQRAKVDKLDEEPEPCVFSVGFPSPCRRLRWSCGLPYRMRQSRFCRTAD